MRHQKDQDIELYRDRRQFPDESSLPVIFVCSRPFVYVHRSHEVVHQYYFYAVLHDRFPDGPQQILFFITFDDPAVVDIGFVTIPGINQLLVLPGQEPVWRPEVRLILGDVIPARNLEIKPVFVQVIRKFPGIGECHISLVHRIPHNLACQRALAVTALAGDQADHPERQPAVKHPVQLRDPGFQLRQLVDVHRFHICQRQHPLHRNQHRILHRPPDCPGSALLQEFIGVFASLVVFLPHVPDFSWETPADVF